MLKKILNLLVGILFLPVSFSASVILYQQLSHIRVASYYYQRFFLFGLIAYIVMHAFIFRPAYLYVVGHEIMHALATWLSFGKVKSIKVSSRGGSVSSTKSNIFIALAPYLFPFYTVLVAAIFFLLPRAFGIEPSQSVFMFLIGFTLSFHLVLTAQFLRTKQSDFLHAGRLTSVALIYTLNLVIVAGIFSIFFKECIFTEFLSGVYFKSVDTYSSIFRQLFL